MPLIFDGVARELQARVPDRAGFACEFRWRPVTDPVSPWKAEADNSDTQEAWQVGPQEQTVEVQARMIYTDGLKGPWAPFCKTIDIPVSREVLYEAVADCPTMDGTFIGQRITETGGVGRTWTWADTLENTEVGSEGLVAKETFRPVYRNTGRLDTGLIASNIPRALMADGVAGGKISAFRVNPWSGSIALDVEEQATTEQAEFTDAFFRNFALGCRTQARRPGVVAITSFTGGRIVRHSTGRPNLILNAGTFGNVESWATAGANDVLSLNWLRVLSSTAGDAASPTFVAFGLSNGITGLTSKLLRAEVQASFRLVIETSGQFAVLPIYAGTPTGAQRYTWSLPHDSDADTAMRAIFGQIPVPPASAPTGGWSQDFRVALIYTPDWIDGDDWMAAFRIETTDRVFTLESVDDDESPYTALPMNADVVREMQLYGRYTDATQDVDYYTLDERERCEGDPMSRWIPVPSIVPRDDRFVYIRTRGSHIVPPEISTAQDQRDRVDFIPTVVGFDVTTRPRGTDDTFPIEYYSVSRWSVESNNYLEYSPWISGGERYLPAYEGIVTYPTGSRIVQTDPMVSAEIEPTVSFYQKPLEDADGIIPPVSEMDRLFTVELFIRTSGRNLSDFRYVAASGSIEISTVEPLTLGPAGIGQDITNDDLEVTSAGGFIGRGGIEYARFQVKFRSRVVVMEVSKSATALTALARPTLTRTARSGANVTVAITNIGSGAAQWELHKSTTSGTAWPDDPHVILPVGTGSYTEAITANTWYRARLIAPRRTPSAYSATVYEALGANPALVIDDVLNISFNNGDWGRSLDPIQPRLLPTGRGVGNVTWGIRRQQNPDWNLASLEIADLANPPVFSSGTGRTELRMPLRTTGNDLTIAPTGDSTFTRTFSLDSDGNGVWTVTFTLIPRPFWAFQFITTDSATPRPQQDTEDFTVSWRGGVAPIATFAYHHAGQTAATHGFAAIIFTEDSTEVSHVDAQVGAHPITYISQRRFTIIYAAETNDPAVAANVADSLLFVGYDLADLETASPSRRALTQA